MSRFDKVTNALGIIDLRKSWPTNPALAPFASFTDRQLLLLALSELANALDEYPEDAP